MVIEMAGGRVLVGENVSVGIDSAHAEAGVGHEPVLLKIEIVLDEESAGERVISDAIAAYPGIDQRQRENKNQNQNFFVPREPNQAKSSFDGF
jgi:hypothetical protein